MQETKETWIDSKREFLKGSVADYQEIDNSIIDTINGYLIDNFFKVDYHSDDNLFEKFKVQKTGKIDLTYIDNRISIMSHFIKNDPKFKFEKEEVDALANVFKHYGMKNRHIEHKDYTEIDYNEKDATDYPISSLFKLIKQEIKNLTKQIDFMSVGFFLLRVGTNLSFKDNVPLNIQKKLAEYFKNTFIVMKEYFPEDVIDKALSEFIFNFSESNISFPIIKNITIKADSDKSIIIFNKANLRKTNIKLLNYIISEKSPLISGIIFDDCSFEKSSLPIANSQILFKNCMFLEDFLMETSISNPIIFENCHFYKKFIINNCTIEKDLVIRDCNFHSAFKITKSQLSGRIELSRLTLWDIFDFSDSVLGPQCHFKNFAYNSEMTPQITECKNIFAKLLEKYGYNSIISILQLVGNNKKSSKLDMDAYQAAYATGFLNPDFAAFCIGRSKIFLAKKRQADRKKLSQQSIPFIISGKDIQYPVEVLLAFKSKNWDKLKEFREKYPIPKDAD